MLGSEENRFRSLTPVLRIFDDAKARDFYLGFLGFDLVFEHRFGDDFPAHAH
ncbi:MAG: glyoxalase superfamily protein, partial [Pseudomonadota bacterium]